MKKLSDASLSRLYELFTAFGVPVRVNEYGSFCVLSSDENTRTSEEVISCNSPESAARFEQLLNVFSCFVELGVSLDHIKSGYYPEGFFNWGDNSPETNRSLAMSDALRFLVNIDSSISILSRDSDLSDLFDERSKIRHLVNEVMEKGVGKVSTVEYAHGLASCSDDLVLAYGRLFSELRPDQLN